MIKLMKKIFFPNTEDDEIISIFRLDKFPKNLMPLLSEIIVGFIFFSKNGYINSKQEIHGHLNPLQQ